MILTQSSGEHNLQGGGVVSRNLYSTLRDFTFDCHEPGSFFRFGNIGAGKKRGRGRGGGKKKSTPFKAVAHQPIQKFLY